MSNINEKITFGLEIEAVQLRPRYLDRLGGRVVHTHDRTVVDDHGNVISENGGHELILPPMAAEISASQDGNRMEINLGDENIQLINAVLAEVVHVNQSCGIHVHLGRPSKQGLFASSWTPDHVRTFLVAGLALEDKLFSACPPSRATSTHCKKIRSVYSDSDLNSYYPVGKAVNWKYDNKKRYCWLNLIETVRDAPVVNFNDGTFRNTAKGTVRTVEIRSLGETVDPAYIMNWVNLCVRFAAHVAFLPSSLAILKLSHGKVLDDLVDGLKVNARPSHERGATYVCAAS